MQPKGTLQAHFHAELESVSSAGTWTSCQRAGWIREHLNEYIDRYIGFAALCVGKRALVESDIFTVIEIAVEALEEESSGEQVGFPEWRSQLHEALEALRRTGNEEYATKLSEIANSLG